MRSSRLSGSVEARTAGQFNALGGEGVELAIGASNRTSAGGQVGRPSRLVLGLGGDAGRIELDEGQEIAQGGLRYQFAGPREFTGLNVRRDPGGTAFWIGIGLGIAGMSTTFFAPRRRIWARVSADRIQLAGQAGTRRRHDVGTRAAAGQRGAGQAPIPAVAASRAVRRRLRSTG